MHYRITSGDEETDVRAVLVTIANSAQFGNGARIAPGALVDDGWLDLVVVPSARGCATIVALAEVVQRHGAPDPRLHDPEDPPSDDRVRPADVDFTSMASRWNAAPACGSGFIRRRCVWRSNSDRDV